LRKIILIPLLILFITMVNGCKVRDKPSIIYVDDDNTNGPWDGTIEHPYRYIQQAISNASPGDTIIVGEGEYRENLYIDKTLNIVGREKISTIIDGGGVGDTIVVAAERVVIEGFTIKGGGEEEWFTSGIRIIKSNVTIRNCVICDNNLGVFIKNATNTTVYNNVFLNDGITFSIYDEEKMHPSFSIKYFIHNLWNNTLNGKPLYYYLNQRQIMVPDDAGEIIAVNCSYLYIHNISITNMDFPVILVSSNHCIIRDSTFSLNDGEIWLINSDYNLIENNHITHSFHGLCLDYDSDSNIIRSNLLAYNEYMGVIIEYHSNNNWLEKNNFIGNRWCNAYFIQSLRNHWYSNYWDDWVGVRYEKLRLLPKIILGELIEGCPLRFFELDYNPSINPYLN